MPADKGIADGAIRIRATAREMGVDELEPSLEADKDGPRAGQNRMNQSPTLVLPRPSAVLRCTDEISHNTGGFIYFCENFHLAGRVLLI